MKSSLPVSNSDTSREYGPLAQRTTTPLWRCRNSRKAAGAAILCGIGCVLAREFLDRFGVFIQWSAFGLLIVGGLCLLWPLLIAAHRGTLWMKARELLKGGHIQEAAAFQITATPGASKSPSIRKAILANLQPKGVL